MNKSIEYFLRNNFEELIGKTTSFKDIYLTLKKVVPDATTQDCLVVMKMYDAMLAEKYDLTRVGLQFKGWELPSNPTIEDWILYDVDPQITFGVELEMVSKLSREQLVTALSTVLKTPIKTGSFEKGFWTVGTDGSLQSSETYPHAWELRPPILQGRKGMKELKIVMDKLKALNVEKKVEVGKEYRTSTHIHLGNFAASSSVKAKMFCQFHKSNAMFLQKLVSDSRRNGNQYVQWDTERFTEHYSACNLSSWEAFGTVEIRSHQGSYSYDKIAMWILLHQKMAKAALVGEAYRRTSFKHFMDKIEAKPYMRKFFQDRYATLNSAETVPEM